jgi:hypothetical protein
MAWYYTEKAGDQTAVAFTHWGWRYLQINAPGAGETLTAADISATIQHTDVPADRAATFVSDNAMLNTVFGMLQRSGLYVSQETGEDTPTREKGQFLGDSVDVGFANTQSLGERNATKRMIREFIYSQSHVWTSTQSGYCASAPCSYNGYGVLSAGRMNAVYPNGDNMRDIPDYTEAFNDLVWRYYQQSGDLTTLQSAYQAMKNVANYIKANEPSSGAASGLVWTLAGGSGSYANGIIDWPSRLGYVYTNNGARTIHAESAVNAFKDVAAAAAILGNAGDVTTYTNFATDLTNQINAVQKIAGDSLYSDGLAVNSTTLSAASTVGATNIKVGSVAPFTIGDSVALDYGNGALKEVRTVVAIGTTGSGGTGVDLSAPLAFAHASGVTVSTSTATQMFPASATLAADAAAGATNIKVSSVSGFSTSLSTGNAGSAIIVGTGAAREVRTIATVGTAGAAGTGLTLTAPLGAAHLTGALVATPSQQAQTFAVFNGVAPQSSYAGIAEYLAAQHLKTGVMDWGITAEALVLLDRPDILLDYLTNVSQFGPAQVVAQGGTFAWEDWVIGTGNNSMSHGWGSRGVTSMLDGLAGIQVTSPGAATVTIAPPKTGLTSLHSTQWTQRGTVTSNWSRGANGMTLDVVVPDNQLATVSMPAPNGEKYIATGAGAPAYVGLQSGRQIYTVGSGASEFVPAAVTVAIASDHNPSVFGQAVTFTATVAAVPAGLPVPTGSVQFYADGVAIGGPAALDGAGVATSIPVSTLAAGARSITAQYSGDSTFNPGAAPAYSQVVNKSNTTTAIVQDVNPAVAGAPVTFTATVTPVVPGAGLPSGNVQFKSDGVALGSPVALDGSGVATLTTSALTPGPHAISADYAGDGNFNPSSSPAISHTVTDPTTVTVSADFDPTMYHHAVTFTAVVAPVVAAPDVPAGSLQWILDGAPTGLPVTLDAAGHATWTTSTLPIGTHTVSAQYAGAGYFLAASATPINHSVKTRLAALVTISSDVHPSVYGQPVVYTATVSPENPSSGLPVTGFVQWKVDGAPVGGPVALVGGQAQLAYLLPRLAVGTHSVRALYLGSTAYTGFTSPAFLQKITKAHTSALLTTSAPSVPSGTPVTFTATIAPVAPGSGTPSGGTVSFKIDGTALGAPVAVVGGVATFTVTWSLPVGGHTIRAAFSGYADFFGSTATPIIQTITH